MNSQVLPHTYNLVIGDSASRENDMKFMWFFGNMICLGGQAKCCQRHHVDICIRKGTTKIYLCVASKNVSQNVLCRIPSSPTTDDQLSSD